MGLLFSGPGIQDRVTLRSIFSDNSRVWGGPGISKEHPTHECVSEQLNVKQHGISFCLGGRDRLTLYGDWAGGAVWVEFSADLTAVDSRVLHLNIGDLQRSIEIFSVPATMWKTHMLNTSKAIKIWNSSIKCSSYNIWHMVLPTLRWKLLLYMTFTYSWDCFDQLLANGR